MITKFKAFDLAVTFHRLATTIETPAFLKDQFTRASSSIVLNLAEGSGKTSPRDRARFFEYAYASTKECQAILCLLIGAPLEASDLANQLGGMTYRLVQNNRAAT